MLVYLTLTHTSGVVMDKRKEFIVFQTGRMGETFAFDDDDDEMDEDVEDIAVEDDDDEMDEDVEDIAVEDDDDEETEGCENVVPEPEDHRCCR